MSLTWPVTLPGPDQAREELPDFSSSPFVKGISLRAARGRFGVPGPGAIWYRVDRPLVEGSPVSQAMRGVVAADFCNGTSAALDFRQWTFINADLTVSFARQPVGEWILLDAESWIGPDGAGLAAGAAGRQPRLFRPRRAEPRDREAIDRSRRKPAIRRDRHRFAVGCVGT